jgi:tetratricopeptide (TPR) repeat protein
MMKKLFLIGGMIMISAITYGQKKEIKKAEKALKEKDISQSIDYLNQAEGLIANADLDTQTQFYVVKGEAYLADAGNNDSMKMETAGKSFMKAIELSPKGKYAARANIGMSNLRVALVNSAVEDQKRKDYNSATKKLHMSYLAMKNPIDLYNAAESAVLAKDYDNALAYYEELLAMDYSGVRKEYVATSIETGKIVSFFDENTRATHMLSGLYNDPNERMTPSVKGSILRNVAIIYISQGKNDAALAVMGKARAENPDDMSLVRAEADMTYKMGNMERYNELMLEVVASDPTNPELYYNLGVGSAKNGDMENARLHYEKALELDPNYTNALINLATLILQNEGALIEEMNNLGTSTADDKRYEELKTERQNLYLESIPYLETAMKLRPENVELVRTLMNIYGQTGHDVKFKEMKTKLATMEGGN